MAWLVGQDPWHLNHSTPAQLLPWSLPSRVAWSLKNAGSLSLTGRRPLTPLPGHILAPGPAIFGPPRGVFDEKVTAARHFHPSRTRCSIKATPVSVP